MSRLPDLLYASVSTTTTTTTTIIITLITQRIQSHQSHRLAHHHPYYPTPDHQRIETPPHHRHRLPSKTRSNRIPWKRVYILPPTRSPRQFHLRESSHRHYTRSEGPFFANGNSSSVIVIVYGSRSGPGSLRCGAVVPRAAAGVVLNREDIYLTLHGNLGAQSDGDPTMGYCFLYGILFLGSNAVYDQ